VARESGAGKNTEGKLRALSIRQLWAHAITGLSILDKLEVDQLAGWAENLEHQIGNMILTQADPKKPKGRSGRSK
jgi:hypothetical protein